MSSNELKEHRHGQLAQVASLVVGPQRPGTGSGMTFVLLEDEHGMVNVVVWRTNVVVWRTLAERQRQRHELVASQLLGLNGTVETREGVMHVAAGRLEDISEPLQGLDTRS
jgi:error-prone DNA polymerase